MTLRAGIYGRNSHGEAKSIADQLKLGLLAVAEHGWMLTRKYSDETSASRHRTKDREEWPQLLADLAAGELDVLVLWKSARGSRDEIEWLTMLRTCRDRGIVIHVMADQRTYDPRKSRDWKTLADDGINSAYYTEELSENVRRGVTLAAMDGGPHGRVAFGYDRRYHEETQRPLRVPNEHAAIVIEIFDRLDKHTPIRTLESDFRERGLPAPEKSWKRNTIRTIATNLAYIGKRKHAGEVYDAQWPALVDEAVFWRVQALLGDPERKTTKPGKAKYLLTWIATGKCGETLTRTGGRNAENRLQCTIDGCVSIRMADADAVVTRMIIGRLRRPDARQLLVRDDADIAAAQAEVARLNQQLEDARRSFEGPDGISADALARKERTLMPLIEAAKTRTRSDGPAGVIEDLLDADDPGVAWELLEIAAKRRVTSHMARIVIGSSTRYMRRASIEARLDEAIQRLGESSWAGDDRTWAELAAG